MFVVNVSYTQSRMEGNIRNAGGGSLITEGRYGGLVAVAAVKT